MSSPTSANPTPVKSRPRQHRPVARIVAALVAVAATVVAVTACGASVTGSPQPNAAAAATAATTTAPSTTTRSTPTTDDESTTSRPSRPSEPTDLTELTELTELTDLTDVTDLSDLTIPTDIPGFSGECAAVSIAYLAVVFAPLSALDSSGTYDAAELQKSLDELNASAEIPAELAPDFQALTELAQQANGQSIEQAGQLFSSEQFTTASDHISKWVDANCQG